MNALTKEWIEKAEADLEVARLTLEKANESLAFTICFHAQQCAEKHVKAYLTDHKIPFPRIHDMTDLMELAKPRDTEFESLRDDLLLVDQYSVDVRYPGRNATWDEAIQAVEACERIREFVRKKLEMDEDVDKSVAGSE